MADFAPAVSDPQSSDPSIPSYTLERRQGAETDSGFAISIDGVQLRSSNDADAVFDHLVRTISRVALEETPSNYLLVHAGVAATPSGAGVLLTGEPGSGKTTTVAALVQEGYSYLSDEAAVIDPDTLLVRPWARPLGFKPGTDAIDRFRGLFGHAASPIRHIPVACIREGAVGAPCAVRVIIDYRYEPDTPTVVEPISRGTAVGLLGSATPALRDHGDAGLQLLARVVSGASSYRLRSGSLDDAVHSVRTLAEDFS